MSPPSISPTVASPASQDSFDVASPEPEIAADAQVALNAWRRAQEASLCPSGGAALIAPAPTQGEPSL